ncbi:hypothetical protein A2U01_0051260, partial [Trifolium medium]|nr:hypothetical protein [Trifolium medium]
GVGALHASAKDRLEIALSIACHAGEDDSSRQSVRRMHQEFLCQLRVAQLHVARRAPS